MTSRRLLSRSISRKELPNTNMVEFDDDIYEVIDDNPPEPEVYTCLICAGTFSNTFDLSTHHGLKHAIKETLVVEGITFHYFETDANFKSWIAADEDGYSRRYFRGCDWQGAGWYIILHGEERCRRGCCTDWVDSVHPVAQALPRFERDVEAATRELDKLRNIKEAVEKLST
jgi:hypothetical protein